MKKAILLFVFLLNVLRMWSQTNPDSQKIDSVFKHFEIEGSFVLYDQKTGDYLRYNEQQCDIEVVPGQTFNLMYALCAIESENINAASMKFFPKCYMGNLNSKTGTSDPAYDNVQIDYWENVITGIKKKSIKKAVVANAFGNKAFNPKEDPRFLGSLRISPNDQVEFLKKFYSKNLTFASNTVEMIKSEVTFEDTLGNSIFCLGEIKPSIDQPYNCWLTGYIATDNNVFFFAIHCDKYKSTDKLNQFPELLASLFRLKGIYPALKFPESPKPPLPKPTLDEMIGQMILVGVDGTDVDSTNSTIKAIKKGWAGGVILYEKNIALENSPELIKTLVSDLQKYAKVPLFICIDQEGGKVNRLKTKYGFPKSVTHEFLGKTDNLDSTRQYSDTMGYILSKLGINVNFAPVVDLSLTDNFIKRYGRCFSDDPEIVAKHAIEFIKAHQKYNIITSLKHFPGHGSATGDSHMGMVNVTDTWNSFETIPYKRIIDSGYCDAVMTAHIINFNLDTDSLPATLSKKVIQGMLRDSLGFDGLVFSDDMQMKAISQFYGFENAIKLCINAGVDVLMYSHNIYGTTDQKAEMVFDAIKKLIIDGEISKERIEQSYKRIMVLKGKYISLTL